MAAQPEKSTKYRALASGPVKAHVSVTCSTPKELGRPINPHSDLQAYREHSHQQQGRGEGPPETHILQIQRELVSNN